MQCFESFLALAYKHISNTQNVLTFCSHTDVSGLHVPLSSNYHKYLALSLTIFLLTEKAITEEISGKSESNPGTPEVETELEEVVDEDVEEVKPEGKKTAKKKRLIAPIRIKLTKMSANQKLQKSLV